MICSSIYISIIYYRVPRNSSFKVLTIEFRRGELIHLRTEDTLAAARCGIAKPEIASESNSSQLSSNARQSNKREFLWPHPQRCILRVFVASSQTNNPPGSAGQERVLASLYSYSCHGSLQSCSHTNVGNSFHPTYEMARPLASASLCEGEIGTPLNEDAIIRLHQRFLPWRSWNFAHFGRIPSASSPSSFQPQWQTMTRTSTTTTTMENSKQLSGTSLSVVCGFVRAISPQVASDWF